MVKLYCKALAEETTLYNFASLTESFVGARTGERELGILDDTF